MRRHNVTFPFQFLLGRLETIELDADKDKELMFQFLLGRLETPGNSSTSTTPKVFQFLLGRLETEYGVLLYRDKLRFNSS